MRTDDDNKENKAESRPYTSEQLAGIKKIKAAKARGDLYGVLGLERGCSESEVKKAYRKANSTRFAYSQS